MLFDGVLGVSPSCHSALHLCCDVQNLQRTVLTRVAAVHSSPFSLLIEVAEVVVISSDEEIEECVLPIASPVFVRNYRGS